MQIFQTIKKNALQRWKRRKAEREKIKRTIYLMHVNGIFR